MPFSYALNYDNSIWTPVTTGGVTKWQPALNWGWNAANSAATGYVTYSETSTTSNSPCVDTGTTTWSNYVYHDSLGVSHPFNISVWTRFVPCIHPPALTTNGTQSGTATDGSGIGISATSAGWTVSLPSGQLITSTSTTVTDANGNKLTASGGEYFDTLSSTTPVLTVSGSATSSPMTLTYTAPSGASASYTVTYEPYTVATNFGISGITEYAPTTVPLVQSITLPDSTSYMFTYEQTPSQSCSVNSGSYVSYCVTGRVASVTLPTGGMITYAYSGGPSSTGIYSDGSSGTLTRVLCPTSSTCTSAPTWTYARAPASGSSSPGPGSTWTTTVTDPASDTTVDNFAEDSTTGLGATYNLYLTQQQINDVNLGLLATNTVCYNSHYSNCGTATTVTPPGLIDTYTQPAGGNTRLSEVFYNGSGAVSVDKEYDYGVTTGSAPGTAHLLSETMTEFAAISGGPTNEPSTVQVQDGSGNRLSYVAYTYDQTAVTATSGTPQHVSVTNGRGNLTTIQSEVNSSTSLYQTFTYYNTGNVSTSTDVSTSSTTAGAPTTYLYSSGSCGNSFATGVNEPLSLSRSTAWNCSGGVETSATDENSQTVGSNYSDPKFWRPAYIYDQQSNNTYVTYPSTTSIETALRFNGGSSVADMLTTSDSFGRGILSQRKQSPSASNYDTTETDYNGLGQAIRSTMPFSASAGTLSSSAPGVGTAYDALGRPLVVTAADNGTTTYTYTANDVLVTVSGPTGTQTFEKNLEYDGLGRLTSVCEISSTLPGVGSCGQGVSYTGYLTKYAYGPNTLTVTQNAQATTGQQTRSYAYDMIGRLTSETNPETGTTSYTYDVAAGTNCAASAGNMTMRTDNAGNRTCYTYDALHRLTDAGADVPVSGSVCRHFRYDTSPTPYNGGVMPTGVSVLNTKTRLEEASTDNCTYSSFLTDEWFSYSARGELTDVYEHTPNSGGYYHTTTSYWPSGALETLSGIPSVPTLTYGLEGEGRYTSVSASSGTSPVSYVSYSTSPLGALSGVTYGSGDSDGFNYDPNTGRPTNYIFNVGTAVDIGTLTWSKNGTLSSLSIADGISGTGDSQSCGYSYDDLSRVGGVDCGGSIWQQTFSYDAFSNINKTASSGGVSFAPGYSTSTNQITTGGMGTYDGNGNMQSDVNNTYTWDPNWGTLASVNGNTATYDALGNAVELNNGSVEVLYSPLGKTALMSGSTLVSAFVNLPGGGTAVYNSSGLAYYRHADWLGSSRLASTPSRTPYSSTAYAPFGETYATAGTGDQNFTGMNSDTVSTLYDFPARRLSPWMGRWISPDPSGTNAVDPTSPQTWNRYAYVSNNPLSFVDPLGLDQDMFYCAVMAYLGYPCPSGGGGGGGGGGDDGGGGGIGSLNLGGGGSSWSGVGWGPGGFGGVPGNSALNVSYNPAPSNAPCQLVAPGGNYNVGANASALFQPPMANALTNAFNFLNSQGITPTINSGYRSPADQARMQNGGSGPNPAARVSWHQVGMAVDINGTSSSFFPTIISAMQAQGLTWGGTFTHRDPPHFQLPRAGTSPTAAMVSACGGGHG